jgi:hypothetical protein
MLLIKIGIVIRDTEREGKNTPKYGNGNITGHMPGIVLWIRLMPKGDEVQVK